MNAEYILVVNVLQVLKRAFDAIGNVRKYLTEGNLAKTMDFKLVKKIESEFKYWGAFS